MKHILKAIEEMKAAYAELSEQEKRQYPFEEWVWLNSDMFGKLIMNNVTDFDKLLN